MAWLLPRLLATIVALTLGAALGVLAGAALKSPAIGAVVGASAAVGLLVLRDALHAGRLVRWLRDGPGIDAPRDAGLWGELAYRIERTLRLRDQTLAAEQQRLGQFLSAIEASPNGVLLLDADDQITWCSAVAADHLGLDAQRDLGQPVTNLVRMPAFVAYLQDGAWRESDHPGFTRWSGHAAGGAAGLWRPAEAGDHPGCDRAPARRGHAAGFCRQRLA